MKMRYLFRYFFKNALHNFLFWLVLFFVAWWLLKPFLSNLRAMRDQSQLATALLNERGFLEQLNYAFYILGFFFAPALGIIAGRALVSKESEILLAHRISRRDFYLGSFAFYGLFLVFIWLIFILLYLLITSVFHQPITLELLFRLLISLFGLLLPFLWVGFFSLHAKPIVVILFYIIVFLIISSVASGSGTPEVGSRKILITAAKLVSLLVPQVQSLQNIASPFSKLNKTLTNLESLKWFCYGIIWSIFLLLSGFLVYRKKDLVDPHS